MGGKLTGCPVDDQHSAFCPEERAGYAAGCARRSSLLERASNKQ